MSGAGDFDRRVTIQRQAAGPNEFNEMVGGFVDYLARLPAKFRNATARERLAAAEIGAEITTVFEIRYSTAAAAIKTSDRLLFDGADYDINAIEEIGRRKRLKITATARAA